MRDYTLAARQPADKDWARWSLSGRLVLPCRQCGQVLGAVGWTYKDGELQHKRCPRRKGEAPSC